MKVNPALEDAFIPMEAKDLAALQEQKRKRNEHWLRMRRARELWFEETGTHAKNFATINSKFWVWLATTYGIIPERDDAGNIAEGFAIIDEKLYTLFLLKFGQ